MNDVTPVGGRGQCICDVRYKDEGKFSILLWLGIRKCPNLRDIIYE